MDYFNIQIAIIIPVYNVEKKLKRCITSILRQSFKEYLLILVDDGSSDNSGKICDSYAQKDKRIYVIHQENKGSLEARKTGLFSKKVQEAKYVMLCDADDTMPKNALEVLLEKAEQYQADCVCGNTRKKFGNILIPRCLIRFVPPCFRSRDVEVYNHTDIMEELYISCFGISNYPVNLWAKLYRRDLLSDAIDFDSFVHFMGEDLSVTLQIMPKINKLVIIPDVVYYYHMGGGTSEFMPYMLDDFLALYRYKNKLRQQYIMDSNVKTFVDIELMNIVNSYLQMCKYPGRFSEEKLCREVSKVIMIPEVQAAAFTLNESGNNNIIAKWIIKKDIGAIINYVNGWYKQIRLKRWIKNWVH